MSSSSPSLVSIRTLSDLWQYFKCLLTDSRYFLTLAALVVLGDAVLTQLIIRFVPCTNPMLLCNAHSAYQRSVQTLKSTGRRICSSWSST